MSDLKGKTIIITGASRGIGLAIALRYAREGANIALISKDDPSNLDEVARQIHELKAEPLIYNIDVSDIQAVRQAVARTVEQFGAIDIVVNNVSATCFTNSLDTLPHQFDFLISTSVRAAFFLSQICVPYLKNAANPHIINISPPLYLEPHWFKDHLAFSIAKYAMSYCTLGMAEEFRGLGIAVNSLWPETTIATQTIKDHFSSKVYSGSRWPSIMADAAYELVRRPSSECTGNFFIDEELLRQSGQKEFSHYAVNENVPLMQALFVPKDSKKDVVSQDLFLKNHSEFN